MQTLVMAEWHLQKDDESRYLDKDLDNIQNLFISGKVTKMYQLAKRSPTKIAKLLGLNYGSYITKLQSPEKFSVLHINILAYAIKIDPDRIHNIIQKEIESQVREVVRRFEGGKDS